MIAWLLKTLEKNPASVFRKKDLIRKSKEQFEELKTRGLLTYVQPDPDHETYPCTMPCSNGCPMDVVNMEGEQFAICPDDTEIDPILLSKDDISRYDFSLEMLIKVIREANDFAGNSYSLNPCLHFIGDRIIKEVNTAFVIALFPNAEAAEPHLLSLPTRIAANYQQVVVITPNLSLTQEPIYAKLRNASIFPVTLGPSFGQQDFKISYLDSLPKPMSQDKTKRPRGPGANIGGMLWQEAQKRAEALVDEKGYLGFNKLYKAVGCSEGTLRKVITEKSSKLRQAKEDYESISKTLKAVGLTSKVVATYEAQPDVPELTDVEVDGIIAEMLERIKQERSEMFESTKEQLGNMNPDQKRDFAAVYKRDYQGKKSVLKKAGPKTQRQHNQV